MAVAALRLVGDGERELTAEEKAYRWLTEVADDDILVCRGRGPRHGFDPLVRGRPLKNTWSFPVDEPRYRECYRLVQLCPDCELVWRELTTGAGGEIFEPSRWRYWRDPRYSPPKGSGRIRASAVRAGVVAAAGRGGDDRGAGRPETAETGPGVPGGGGSAR